MQLSDLIRTYSDHMFKLYGEKVYRVGVSTGIPCPHRQAGGCVYCNPDSFRGDYQNRALSIEQQLDKGIEIISRNTRAESFIAYFQDETSTAGNIDYLRDIFSRALSYPQIKGLVISTRPDYVDEDICEMLRSLSKSVILEIGVQSIHQASLDYLRRGHSQEDSENAINLCQRYGIETGVHLIMGIPGEDFSDMQKTIQWVSDNPGIKEVKLHNLVIYRGTELAKLWKEGKIEQMPIDDYIEILSELIPWIREDIVISRLFTSNILHNDLGVIELSGKKTKWMNQLRLKLENKGYRQGIKYNLIRINRN